MPFYITDKNRPNPKNQSRLRGRLERAGIKEIVIDELDAGATCEELLGMIISMVSTTIGEETMLRTIRERRAEKEAMLLNKVGGRPGTAGDAPIVHSFSGLSRRPQKVSVLAALSALSKQQED